MWFTTRFQRCLTDMLSHELFHEVRPGFLRLLGTPSAAIYIDVSDSLESEVALRTGPLGRDEALELIERVLGKHAEIEVEDTADLSTRERAQVVMERLLAAEWITSEDRSDYKRFIGVEPNAALFLETLRKIARPEAAVFPTHLSQLVMR